MSNKQEFQKIFDNLIEKMETAGKWVKPWTVRAGSGAPTSLSTGKPYRGINSLILSIVGEVMGYESSKWATIKQINAKGGRVLKGEKHQKVCFFKQLTFTETDEKTGEDKTRRVPLLRHFRVFNLDQTTLEDKDLDQGTDDRTPTERLQAAEDIVAGYNGRPEIRYKGGNAYYMPSEDFIVVPEADDFHGTAEFYGTLFHEMIHSTGHKSRLDRLETGFSFGDHSYSREELVAEIGAAYLRSACGLAEAEADRNSAAYIRGWWGKIKKDPEALKWAAGKAQQATDHVLGLEYVPSDDSGDKSPKHRTTGRKGKSLAHAPELVDEFAGGNWVDALKFLRSKGDSKSSRREAQALVDAKRAAQGVGV